MFFLVFFGVAISQKLIFNKNENTNALYNLCPSVFQEKFPYCDMIVPRYTTNFSASPSISYGCDNEHYVTHISLRYRNCADGQLSAEIASLSRLAYLDIRDANFAGTIPSEIATLAALTMLLLSGNNFRGTVPETLVGISSNLVSCSIVRDTNETNCFDCPVPNLNCTSPLKCDSNCTDITTVTTTLTTKSTSTTTTKVFKTSTNTVTSTSSSETTPISAYTKQSDVTADKNTVATTIRAVSTSTSTAISNETQTTAKAQPSHSTTSALIETTTDSGFMASPSFGTKIDTTIIVIIMAVIVAVAFAIIGLLSFLYRRARRRIGDDKVPTKAETNTAPISDAATQSELKSIYAPFSLPEEQHYSDAASIREQNPDAHYATFVGVEELNN